MEIKHLQDTATMITQGATGFGQMLSGAGQMVAGGIDHQKALLEAEAQRRQTDQQTYQSQQSTATGIAQSGKSGELISAMQTLLQQIHSINEAIFNAY